MGSLGAEIFAHFTLQELFRVVETGANGAFRATHDVGYLRVTEAIDFE
jgi:hypothetical protein